MQKINQHYTKEQEIEKKYSRNNQSPDDLTCYLVFARPDFANDADYCQFMYDKYAFTPEELKSRLRYFYNHDNVHKLFDYKNFKNFNMLQFVKAAISLHSFVS